MQAREGREGTEISGKAPWQVARAAEDALIAQLRAEAEALNLGPTCDRKTPSCLRKHLRNGVTAEELSMGFLGVARDETFAWIRKNIKCPFAWLVSTSERRSRYAHQGRKHAEAEQFAAAHARREREARAAGAPKPATAMDTLGFGAALAKIPGHRPSPAATLPPARAVASRPSAQNPAPVASPPSPPTRAFGGTTAARPTETQTRATPALAAPVTSARPSAVGAEDDTDWASLAPRFETPTPTTEQPRLRLVGRDPPPPSQGPTRLHMRIATSRDVPVADWLVALTPTHLREGGSIPGPSAK